MVKYSKNGNGATVVTMVKGAGIGARHASEPQRAAMAAAILAGEVVFVPSQCQLSQLFGVSVPYIGIAKKKLSAAESAAVMAGAYFTDMFSALLSEPKALPAAPAQKIASNAEQEDIIRVAGIERTLVAAVAVERTLATAVAVETHAPKSNGKTTNGTGLHARPVASAIVNVTAH